MSAAIRSGHTWPTICGGKGTCKTCVCLILEGEENLIPVEPFEAEGLETIASSIPSNGKARLACQAKPTGDVKVRKIGVRAA